MTDPFKVAVLLGSLRAASYSRMIANALLSIAPRSLDLQVVEIAELPLYNEDFEAYTTLPWASFRERISAVDAVIFVTPEYNRSVPGALKNALDVGSRPYGKSVFAHKPAAVISQSQGAMGGFGANHALRQSLVFLDMPTLQQPEVYLGGSAQLFDEMRALKNDQVSALLTSFLEAFTNWVAKNSLRSV